MADQECIPMLKALADETRWRLVEELLKAPATVNELTERISASQYNVSKHLKVLEDSGIVQKQKSGKHVHCQIAPAFRQQLTQNGQELDLGCCTFRFSQAIAFRPK